MDGKTKAIVAHITWIGWLFVLIINLRQKDEITSFYLRQLLGIWLFGLVILLILVIYSTEDAESSILQFDIVMACNIGNIACLIFWILSLIGAVRGKMKEIPIVGKYFQDWFKGI